MRVEWVFIEALAVLVENLVFIYFLYNRFSSKRDWYRPEILTWVIASLYALVIANTGLPGWVYDIGNSAILLAYICIAKHGKLLHKVLMVILLDAIVIVTSLLGAGVISALTDVNIAHTLEHQDASRLLSIIFIISSVISSKLQYTRFVDKKLVLAE